MTNLFIGIGIYLIFCFLIWYYLHPGAYSRGKKAKINGEWIENNPYADYTTNWQLWNQGWHSIN